MKHLQKMCLSCVNFRAKSAEEGICKTDKSLSPKYPVFRHTDSCDRWKTCGQQYYIRLGWVKKQKEKTMDAESRT